MFQLQSPNFEKSIWREDFESICRKDFQSLEWDKFVGE